MPNDNRRRAAGNWQPPEEDARWSAGRSGAEHGVTTCACQGPGFWRTGCWPQDGQASGRPFESPGSGNPTRYRPLAWTQLCSNLPLRLHPKFSSIGPDSPPLSSVVAASHCPTSLPRAASHFLAYHCAIEGCTWAIARVAPLFFLLGAAAPRTIAKWACFSHAVVVVVVTTKSLPHTRVLGAQL